MRISVAVRVGVRVIVVVMSEDEVMVRVRMRGIWRIVRVVIVMCGVPACGVRPGSLLCLRRHTKLVR